MTINPLNRTAFTCLSIPANVCKHAAIFSAFSLCTDNQSSPSLKSRELNKILGCSELKGVFHRKKAKNTLLEGYKNLSTNTPDINNNTNSTHIAAKECFKKVAKYGFQIGNFLLGDMYIQYANTLEDQEEGIAYLTEAADKNYLYACLSLATIYAYKAESDVSYKTQAIAYYKKAGKLGSPDAYLRLAEIFQNRAEKNHFRENITSDYEKVVKYYKKAAKLHSSNAYFRLAELYTNCNDTAQATTYYKQAAELGCKRSALFLGRSYLYDHATEENLNQAINFLEKAGDLRSSLENKICSWKNSGSTPAEKYLLLADIFRESASLEQDPSLKKIYTDKTLSYYKKAGKLEGSETFSKANLAASAEAYLRLSSIYSCGGMEVNRDPEKAIVYLEKAVLLRSSVASARLKTIYTQLAEQYLLNENLQQAVNFYEKAGKHGSSEAYFRLGEMCLSGRIPRNLNTMLQYYKKAADNSHAQACNRLYEIYKYGIAEQIAPNIKEARKYLQTAQ